MKTGKSKNSPEILHHLGKTLDIEDTLKKYALTREELGRILVAESGIKETPVHAQGHLHLHGHARKLVIRFDGACRGNPGESAAGYTIREDGKPIAMKGVRLGVMTNNQAEYESLILALTEASKLTGKKEVKIFADSALVVHQVNGDWKINHPVLAEKRRKVVELLRNFTSFEICHVPREENAEADALANEAYEK